MARGMKGAEEGKANAFRLKVQVPLAIYGEGLGERSCPLRIYGKRKNDG